MGMLIFFMLSFILRQLDYIWHGFHFTNMIPYRFSFLFSFVVLVMGYRGYGLEKAAPVAGGPVYGVFPGAGGLL